VHWYFYWDMSVIKSLSNIPVVPVTRILSCFLVISDNVEWSLRSTSSIDVKKWRFTVNNVRKHFQHMWCHLQSAPVHLHKNPPQGATLPTFIKNSAAAKQKLKTSRRKFHQSAEKVHQAAIAQNRGMCFICKIWTGTEKRLFVNTYILLDSETTCRLDSVQVQGIKHFQSKYMLASCEAF